MSAWTEMYINPHLIPWLAMIISWKQVCKEFGRRQGSKRYPFIRSYSKTFYILVGDNTMLWSSLYFALVCIICFCGYMLSKIYRHIYRSQCWAKGKIRPAFPKFIYTWHQVYQCLSSLFTRTLGKLSLAKGSWQPALIVSFVLSLTFDKAQQMLLIKQLFKQLMCGWILLLVSQIHKNVCFQECLIIRSGRLSGSEKKFASSSLEVKSLVRSRNFICKRPENKLCYFYIEYLL